MTTSTEIYDTIKAKREERMKAINKTAQDLSNASLKKYTNTINSLYRNMKFSTPLTPELYITEKDAINEFLKDKEPSLRRNIYTALFVYTNDDDYKELMSSDIATYQNQMKERQRSNKQKQNWITRKEIYSKLDELEFQAQIVYEKHSLGQSLTDKDYQDIQDYMLLLLMSDKHFPIRRSLDWTSFKISDINLEEDNYITEDGSAIVFNTYKTSKTKGRQTLTFSKYKFRNNKDWDFYSKKGAEIISTELQKWIAINPTEHLFFTKMRKQLSSYNITNWFNRIFQKPVSTNMLRVALMTAKNEKILNDLEQATRSLIVGGSSQNLLYTYIKQLMGDDV